MTEAEEDLIMLPMAAHLSAVVTGADSLLAIPALLAILVETFKAVPPAQRSRLLQCVLDAIREQVTELDNGPHAA